MTRYRRTQLAWPLIGILGAVMALSLWRVAFAVDAIALLVLVSAVVLMLFATLTVSLDGEYLHVRFGVGLIRRRFPSPGIRLPPIELRTNGFAVGGTLRGNFRLTGLGTGQLFVNRGDPPFVVIKRARGF